jgi:N-acetylneuraminic acid mutarotase
MFGGVIRQNEITNDFWEFDLDTQIWTQLAVHNGSALAFPMATAGHTAHIVNNEMHVLFGYNPFEGYLYTPQIFSFGKH